MQITINVPDDDPIHDILHRTTTHVVASKEERTKEMLFLETLQNMSMFQEFIDEQIKNGHTASLWHTPTILNKLTDSQILEPAPVGHKITKKGSMVFLLFAYLLNTQSTIHVH